MMEKEKLLEEIDDIYGFIKEKLDRTPEGLMAELENRCAWLARSAELKAEAQFILDQARGRAAEEYIESSATVFKELINRDTAQENKILQLADRLNSTLTHQIDAVRSILSFEKESRKHL